MNQQAAVMIRWLLSGDGGLKNLAQLLTDSFAPAAAAAATIDTTNGTITAYPSDPTAVPSGQQWSPTEHGWTHPFDPPTMPLSSTADHHVVVGITSRNELLVINLAAAAYLGIEGAAPIPVMRSWMMQLLTKTPTAQVAVTDPALSIPAVPRLSTVPTAADAPAGTTIVFTTEHTGAPDPGGPLLVSSSAVGADNELLCDEALAGIYVANRYWPLWRRLEIPDVSWDRIAEALPPANTPAPPPPIADDRTPESADVAVVEAEDPVHAAADQPNPAAEPAAERVSHPVPELPLTPAAGPARAATETPLVAPAPQRGIYALGETYVLGVDPTTGQPAQHSAVTRQGARKPVLAMMMLAIAPPDGLTRQSWDDLLKTSPQNRRQVRTQIRKLLGGHDPIQMHDDAGREHLRIEIYCDWKEFQELIGSDPLSASTDKLEAAVQLIRGAPFADIPDADYQWREYVLLKDRLLDQCSDAALELARRRRAADRPDEAHRLAMLGIRVYPLREDLWEMAAATVTEADRPALIFDLKEAIPNPKSAELRELLASDRPRRRREGASA